MKLNHHNRRLLASALALCTALGGLPISAGAAERPSPTWDETYYATMDYYGGLTESSVVKSVRTYGNPVLTDYGVYDQVINLTDSREGTAEDGRLTFDLTGSVPEQFCFEGKTARPYDQFPWRLSLSYGLNGLPARAEDLAGEKGVVEITLDAVPNPSAPAYSRNNLVLTAMSLFNGDDILSLEAPGAQVQLVGNLYCVLYAVLPGEEQHFTIRVGTEDFSYNGMIFLAVPATLAQLDQVADLREAKETAEDSYHAIQDSMDVILDTLDGMSGSLNAAADGLDQLNRARDTISQGKGQVYSSTDAALDALSRTDGEGGQDPTTLAGALQPASGHLTAAQQALTDTRDQLNQMSGNLTSLKPEVEQSRRLLADLKSNLSDLQALMDDLEKYPDQGRRIAGSLGEALDGLSDSLEQLRRELSGVTGISNVDLIPIPGGMSVDQVRAYVQQVNELRGAYDQAGGEGCGLSFQNFIALALVYQASAELQAAFPSFEEFLQAQLAGPVIDLSDSAYSQAVSSSVRLYELYLLSQAPNFEEKLEKAEQANSAIGSVNNKLGEVNQLLIDLSKSSAGAVEALTAVTGDLTELSGMMEQLLKDMDSHGGSLSGTAGTLKDAADLTARISANVDAALDQVQGLTDIMNTYDPEAQQAMEDAKTLTEAASASLTALTGAARSAEGLLRDSGPDLDQGTRQALSGLSASLRSSTAGLEQTDVLRDAKSTIDALVTDQWDSHAGGENNLLLMDAGASPVSLTDPRNEGVRSIQYIMRSQEIKAEEDGEEEEPAAAQEDKGTIWSRIADMFRDIWHTITGWFGG